MYPVEQPFKLYHGNDGLPLDGGSIYFGTANQNPITSPITVYWDVAGTQPALQPLVTQNGYIVRKGTPAIVYCNTAYSELVRDSKGQQVSYSRTSDDFSVSAIIIAFLVNLAASAGSALIGYISSVAGSIARTVQSVLREEVRLLDFIPPAQHAAILAGTSTYDASDNIISAIAAAGALTRGSTVRAPRGKFLCTKEIPFENNVVLCGAGKRATLFEFTHTGNGFVSTNTINSSTAANIGLMHLSIINSNAANTGAGFVDIAGSYVELDFVYFTGFLRGCIFDQTEHLNVDRSEYITPNGGIGIWIVNGPDYTPGVLPNFTNRLTITRTQFNATPAALFNILDDGGVSHTIADCNFNAGLQGIRAAGVAGLSIIHNESEVHGTDDIYLCDTTYSGTYMGPCLAPSIQKNVLGSSAGGRNIAVQNVRGQARRRDRRQAGHRPG